MGDLLSGYQLRYLQVRMGKRGGETQSLAARKVNRSKLFLALVAGKQPIRGGSATNGPLTSVFSALLSGCFRAL